MNTLVTGGAGFIGSHLVRGLLDYGHSVTCVDDESSSSHERFVWDERAKNLKVGIERLKPCDLKGVDVVFHLAAAISVESCNNDPAKTFATNVQGTIHVLDCAARAGAGRLVFSSSAAVYGNGRPYDMLSDERDVCQPVGTYGTSKFMAELACRDYSNLGRIDTVCLRYFNVFGEGQANRGSYSPVVATFLRQLGAGEALTVVGDGYQRRDYIHVGDVVAANMKAACLEEPFGGKSINICTGRSTSVLDIATAICRIVPSASIRFIPSRKEVQTSIGDTHTMTNELKMSPSTDIIRWINRTLGQETTE
jgi:UDP-glucose 4-epimerase